MTGHIAVTGRSLVAVEEPAVRLAEASITANADGPAPWHEPRKSEVLSFLGKTSKDLSRFDPNHDGWLQPKDVTKAARKSRTTAAVLRLAVLK